ncbi:MAG: DUF882 domain-containing protein [Rickettsiales bacterium]
MLLIPHPPYGAPKQPDLSRRQFLKGSAAAAALLALSPLLARPAYAALLQAPVRSLALTNLHTGESCALNYWENGAYVPQALQALNQVLRDHRSNQSRPMDTALFDLLHVLHARLETDAPFQVISGYRSPESNAAMHAHSSGVAGKSLHMEGKAMDIRVAGRSLVAVHNTALAMGLGGVGYYPSSDFVHVDTGRVRRWAGA